MSSKPRRGPSLRDIVGEDVRIVEPRAAVVERLATQPTHEPTVIAPSPAPATLKGQGTLKQRSHQFSTYLEPPVYDALRDIAHAERVKIHALVLEGVDLVLQKRGLPSIAKLMSET
jgi:hypothetical protein